MFFITEPNEQSIERFLEAQKGTAFSYSEVGASRSVAPDNYNVDHNRMKLGTGRAIFDQAVKAVQSWKMFDLGWTKLCWENTPIRVGETVAILAQHFGFWSLNAAQIVYVLEESGGTIEKYGFAYGTLTEHGERGEERFSVEYHKTDETVWYDLYAFSQPNNFLAKVGYPFSRYLQKQFAVESKRAMQRAVENNAASNK